MQNIKVKKRDGTLEQLDISNIRKQTIPACEGLNASYESLELEAGISFKDGMKTSEIADLLEFSALRKCDVDTPDWTFVAARLKLYRIYHSVKHTYLPKKEKGDVYSIVTFKNYLDMVSDRLSFDYKDINVNVEKLNNSIKSERDLLFTAQAVDMLSGRYLIKENKTVIELPQHFFMCLALFLAQNEEDVTSKAIEFYNDMSTLKFLPATPTLANGRLKNGNCFSCATGSTEDNIESIFDTYKTQALGSKSGTGWGWDWTRVRALGGTIQNISGAAGGLVPWMKLENDVAIAVDQLGNRLGAINCSVESWHLDIEDFIDLKKNGGEDRRRAKELFITISCSDLFMSRVENNQDWTLFDPADVPILAETYGEEFEREYLAAEDLAHNAAEKFSNEPKNINAKILWKKMQTMFSETGMPFIFFKDNVNNAADLTLVDGIIRSANLCMEYFTPVKNDEVVLCNLGSINLSKVNIDDKDEMKRVIDSAIRMLDNVIDLTEYPIPNSEYTQRTRRSIGLGVAGEAEYIAGLKITYGSEEHKSKVVELYSHFQECVDNASVKLANERGPWNKDSVYRNYVRSCVAPTTSVAVIMGTTASIESAYDKVWTEEIKLGTYKVTAPNINVDNYNYYIPAYKVDARTSVELTALRQPWFCMGISHNMNFDPKTATGKEVFDAYMLAWKLKMKTVYYYRSKSLRVEDACIMCAG
jgi:ribonucleoside-diphosphate reductase alpha chain